MQEETSQVPHNTFTTLYPDEVILQISISHPPGPVLLTGPKYFAAGPKNILKFINFASCLLVLLWHNTFERAFSLSKICFLFLIKEIWLLCISTSSWVLQERTLIKINQTAAKHQKFIEFEQHLTKNLIFKRKRRTNICFQHLGVNSEMLVDAVWEEINPEINNFLREQ